MCIIDLVLRNSNHRLFTTSSIDIWNLLSSIYKFHPQEKSYYDIIVCEYAAGFLATAAKLWVIPPTFSTRARWSISIVLIPQRDTACDMVTRHHLPSSLSQSAESQLNVPGRVFSYTYAENYCSFSEPGAIAASYQSLIVRLLFD